MYMALIFYVSSREVHLPMARLFPLKDKGLHFVEYSLMGWLCVRATAATWPGAKRWRIALFAIFMASIWGLSDELHQALVPGRSAEVADFAADVLGAIAGTYSWFLVKSRKKKIKI